MQAISRFYPKLVFNIVVYTFPVISVTKCVSIIVRKSVMILKWCIKPRLKRWRWKHVVLLKNGKPAIQKWLNRFFQTITCSLSMISPWPYARVFSLTNLIESFNKQIKKYSHRKEQFQNEESMERFFKSRLLTKNS